MSPASARPGMACHLGLANCSWCEQSLAGNTRKGATPPGACRRSAGRKCTASSASHSCRSLRSVSLRLKTPAQWSRRALATWEGSVLTWPARSRTAVGASSASK
eukprot:8715688-Pyramimonas_sp.AAC.1